MTSLFEQRFACAVGCSVEVEGAAVLLRLAGDCECLSSSDAAERDGGVGCHEACHLQGKQRAMHQLV